MLSLKCILLTLIYVIMLVMHLCQAKQIELKETITETASSPFKKCTLQRNSSTTVKHFGLQFHLPFMDMTIENEHNLYIAQEPFGKQIYVVHGHELYQMVISRGEKRISLIGTLSGSITEKDLLGAEVIIWREYLLLVVAMSDELEVYQLDLVLVEKRMTAGRDLLQFVKAVVPQFDPIQQITLLGQYRKHFLIAPMLERIVLLVTENFSKLSAKQRSFEWLVTFFDPIEEFSLPPISMLSLIGTEPKYLITGRYAKSSPSKSALTMYELTLPELKLKRKQTLTVLSRKIHAFTFRSKNYLITCGLNQTKCSSFRMSNGQFEVYKQRTGQELGFNILKAGPHFLVGERKQEVRVYGSARLDCYTSFKSNLTEASVVYAHSNPFGEEFIVLHYRRVYNSLLRLVEIEAEGGVMLGAAMTNITEIEEPSEQRQQEHQFEDSVGQLRSVLLKRKLAMDVFRRMANVMSPKLSSAKLPNPVRIRNGNIGLIKLVGKTLCSPLQLLQRVDQMRQIQQLSAQRPRRALAIALNSTAKRLKVRQLRVKNLLYAGDILPGFYLDNSTQPLPTLCVRPKISTQSLHTEVLAMRTEYMRYTRQLDVNGVLHTLRLNVQNINGINWAELYDAVYLKNRDTKIVGNLTLRKPTNIIHLQTPFLNDIPVEKYFNLKQPQVVHSNIFITGFLVNDLFADHINGLDFTKDLVLRGQDVLVEGPVMLYQASIAGDMYFGDNSTEQEQQRINEDDNVEFQQFYTGKVVINGSLTINNLWRENVDRAIVMVNGKPLSVKTLQQNYVLRNAKQHVRMPIVFGNAKVSVPSLDTRLLNDHVTSEHLINTAEPQAHQQIEGLWIPPMFVFINAQVNGSVESPERSSKLFELSQQAVRHGMVTNITGIKRFQAPLLIHELYTLELNEVPIEDLILKSQLSKGYTFSGMKIFESVLVGDGLTVIDALNASRLNNLPLDTLLNYNYYFDQLNVSYKLQASNVIFDRINGQPFDEIFRQFQIRDNRLTLHKQLIIEGNARFEEKLRVEHVNGLEWDAYTRSLVRSNEDNATINGEKRFLSELTITDSLQTPLLNDVNLTAVLGNVLLKSRPQEITGIYTFERLHAGNLDVSVINDVPTSAFIDMRSPEVLIESDLFVQELTVLGNWTGHWLHAFDLQSIAPRLAALRQRNWQNLVVLGNASWPNSNSDAMSSSWLQKFTYLQRTAVRRSRNQTITGNVRLHSPYVHKMRTSTNFIPTTELSLIAKDALRMHSERPQIVVATKTFLQPVYMRTLQTNAALNVKLLNNIDVLRFNVSLWRLSAGMQIEGPLHFQTPPSIERLRLSGNVNGVQPHHIYYDRSTKLPAVSVQQLDIIGNLQLGQINGVSINYLLEERVPKQSDLPLELKGMLKFEQLQLSGPVVLQSINGIPIDNLVFQHSKHLQAITGTKHIDGDLVLNGPAHVLRLNGEHLSDAYQKSVMTNDDRSYLFENLVLDAATFESGLVLPTPSPFFRISRANSVNEEEMQQDDHKIVKTQQYFMYFDNDSDTEIHWRKPNETIGQQSLHELGTRYSRCERRLLHVQWAKNGKLLYLNNITSNALSAISDDVMVKAENYCKPRYDKVRSKIKISSKKLAKVIGMKKYIETISLYRTNSGDIFVLLHALDILGRRNEVRILRIDSTRMEIQDWQSIKNGVGQLMQLLLISAQATQIDFSLLAITGILKGQPTVSLYAFEVQTQKFTLSQTVEGDYDLMQLVELNDGKQQLIMSCRQCQRISILSRDTQMERFAILQTLKLNVFIDRLAVFTLSDDRWYLLVLSEHEQDYYNLYKYTQIEGWMHAGYGYYPNIQLALPLVADRRWSVEPLILLLCGSQRRCGLVKAQLR